MPRKIPILFLFFFAAACSPVHDNWSGKITQPGEYKLAKNGYLIKASDSGGLLYYQLRDLQRNLLIDSKQARYKASTYQKWAILLDSNYNLWIQSSDIGTSCWKHMSMGDYKLYELTGDEPILSLLPEEIRSFNPVIIRNGMPDFCKLAESAQESYTGILQGVPANDSAGPYHFTDYYSDSLCFTLFYLPRDRDSVALEFDSLRNAKTNNYYDYICLAFVYPMISPDSLKDYHDTNIKFPVKVKTYVRQKHSWVPILPEGSVNDLTQLSRYEIEKIYRTYAMKGQL